MSRKLLTLTGTLWLVIFTMSLIFFISNGLLPIDQLIVSCGIVIGLHLISTSLGKKWHLASLSIDFLLFLTLFFLSSIVLNIFTISFSSRMSQLLVYLNSGIFFLRLPLIANVLKNRGWG